MRKLFFALFFTVVAISTTNAQPVWTKAQLMEPTELAMQLTAGKDLPLIICVGPGASIPHSVNVGMVKNDSGVQKLKTALNVVPKNSKVVVYCGCCPFDHCPNAKPAMDMLTAMKFTNFYLLNLPNNLKKDWIDKGYPKTNLP